MHFQLLNYFSCPKEGLDLILNHVMICRISCKHVLDTILAQSFWARVVDTRLFSFSSTCPLKSNFFQLSNVIKKIRIREKIYAHLIQELSPPRAKARKNTKKSFLKIINELVQYVYIFFLSYSFLSVSSECLNLLTYFKL